MKLRLLHLLFRLAAWCEGRTTALNELAKRFHKWAWRAWNDQNLKSL
jgi:hypothetical protein